MYSKLRNVAAAVQRVISRKVQRFSDGLGFPIGQRANIADTDRFNVDIPYFIAPRLEVRLSPAEARLLAAQLQYPYALRITADVRPHLLVVGEAPVLCGFLDAIHLAGQRNIVFRVFLVFIHLAERALFQVLQRHILCLERLQPGARRAGDMPGGEGGGCGQ